MYQNVYIDAVFVGKLSDGLYSSATDRIFYKRRQEQMPLSYGSGRWSAFFKYQSLYTGRTDSTNVGHCTDFLCGRNADTCIQDPVLEKTCNGGSDILCACILERWDLDGSDGKVSERPE